MQSITAPASIDVRLMPAALPGNKKDSPVSSDWIDAVGETLSVRVIVKLPGFAVSNVNTAVACCEMLSV